MRLIGAPLGERTPNQPLFKTGSFPVALILMGDWCSKDCNRKIERIFGKGRDAGSLGRSEALKKETFTSTGDVFFLDWAF